MPRTVGMVRLTGHGFYHVLLIGLLLGSPHGPTQRPFVLSGKFMNNSEGFYCQLRLQIIVHSRAPSKLIWSPPNKAILVVDHPGLLDDSTHEDLLAGVHEVALHATRRSGCPTISR